MSFSRKLILAGIGLWLSWFAALAVGTTYLLRRRTPDQSDAPGNYGLDYENVTFTSRDEVKLCGWWIPAEPAIGTIVMCHGQEGSKDGDTQQMLPLHEAGFNVLMFDFRAHGASEGQQVTMGMYEKEDLLGALDYLAQDRHVEKVGVLGFSMGAAAALIAAALSERIAVIVADSSFVRLKYTLQRWLTRRGIPQFIARPFIAGILVGAAVRTEGRIDQADPVLWTPHIGPRPILFIYGDADPFVTPQEVEQMTSQAAGPVQVWFADGVGHRGAYALDPAEYNRRVIDWFKQYCPR